MKAKDLKNSILQMAVEGKLVPQDPTDEPATVLLERIREEKHKLIAEGKAKFPKGGESIIYIASDGSPYEKRVDAKGRVLSEKCITGEVPFEIPKPWVWVRMESILEFINGRAYKKSELLTSGKYPVLRVGNLFTNSTWYYSNLELDSNKYCHNGDLLYAWSASFGPTIWSGPDCIFHYRIWNVKHSEFIDRTYLHWALLQDVLRVRQATTGSTMIHVSMEHMKPRFLPIPPLAEQRRIVERIEQLMPLVEEYGKFEDAREKLDTELPGRLRKSVLQMAVQGKLVPQDPADEPASELLGRIREQRRKLVAEKKMKAPKGGESVICTSSDGRRYEKRMDVKGRESEPVCIEDEIPFEIPESWEWTRLENLADVSGGNTPKKEQLKPVGNIPYFKVADMNSIGNEREMVNAKLYVDDSYTGKTFPAGTIIYPKNGGAVLTNKRRMLVKESVVDLNTGSCTPYLEDCLNYLRLFFETIDFREFYKGTAVPTVNGSLVKELLVPLPSLTEQSRIVKRLEILQNIIV